MHRDFLLGVNKQRMSSHENKFTNNVQDSCLAFSNPEYMCFSELKTIMQNKKMNSSSRQSVGSAVKATPLRKGHRLVPLPPPARPPPPPPCTRPPAIPPKLYQNLPIMPEPIHVDCYSTQRSNLYRPDYNLLKIEADSVQNTFNHDSTAGSSMILLQSSVNTASDSSCATMIIREDEESSVSKSKLSNNMLSPIMSSSRADLQKHNNVLSTFNNESTIFEHNSLPFKRTGNHQRQRRLSFNETLEFVNEEHHQTVEINQTNNTITSVTKSFSNFNYDLYTKAQEQQGSFTTSTSSLSASSSLSSLILQPPSPFKTSMLEAPVQTPTKSNIKSSSMQKKNFKKVSFMLQDDVLLNTSDYDCMENVVPSEACGSISSNSSASSVDLQNEKMIFANHDYFLNLRNQLEPSSSSSSSSSCSSASSVSSGYKSINNSNKVSPTDLNMFIKTNQDRLERLRQKRAELVLAKNTDKLTKILDYSEQEQNITENCMNLKNVSAKLFQSLQTNSPTHATIIRNNLNNLSSRPVISEKIY